MTFSFIHFTFYSVFNILTDTSAGGTVCKNTGWGKFNNLPIGNTPNKLQVVDIPIVERNTCIGWYENVNPVFNTEVCAGTEEGGISPCNVSPFNLNIQSYKEILIFHNK